MKNLRSIISILFLLVVLKTSAQEEPGNFVDGYALRGTDTIKCKILDKGKHSFQGAVTLMIGPDKITFPVNSTITGFGFVSGDDEYHYGVIQVEMRVGTKMVTQPVFVRKLVAGTIDLYEHTYQLRTTKTVTVNGVEKGTPSTTTDRFTNFYISKRDSSNAALSAIQILYSFRKKELSPYLNDNPEMLNRAEKKFNLEELVAVLKEYNSWFLKKSTL